MHKDGCTVVPLYANQLLKGCLGVVVTPITVQLFFEFKLNSSLLCENTIYLSCFLSTFYLQ